jgi:regulator of protease activity HflC (stomatin/prohibitin superfamily)
MVAPFWGSPVASECAVHREIRAAPGLQHTGAEMRQRTWGRVTANANEFLIQMRRGRVIRSGQGLSCFKWPWDSVAIVPTSIARLSFAADQVTTEKVGVEVRGLAVYRIADPLLAFRMIDVDRSSLTEILRDMFVGATRRIVARLTLDECITHRKDLVAEALMGEIAPILAGEGSMLDGNPAGWGVVLDTIEIQDVRVLSQEVFARLQAPFRQKLALEALLAEDRVTQERARLELDRQRAEEHARRELMEAELARARRKAEADRERAAIELEARREAGETEAALVHASRAAYQDLSEARLREVLITETMPEVARAFRASFDRVHVTSTNGDDMFGFLSAGLDHVLAVAREHGASVKK